jgi:hypothetical protein
MAEVKRFVGIDVSKAQLDVALGANEGTFSIANDEHGVRELLERLTPEADLVVLEATGGLGQAAEGRAGPGAGSAGDAAEPVGCHADGREESARQRCEGYPPQH